MIDLAELEKAAGLKFKDPDAAEDLECLALLIGNVRKPAPEPPSLARSEIVPRFRKGGKPKRNIRRKVRNFMAHDINIRTHREDAIRGAIQRIDEIREANGGRGVGVHERKDGEKRRYAGPLVRLVTLLCRQCLVEPPSAHTIHRVIKPKKSTRV